MPGEPLLGLVQVVAALVDYALRIAAHDVLRACRHHHLGARYAGSADAAYDHAEIFHLFVYDLQGVDERGQNHYRGSVLVVVEDGDLDLPLQTLFDLEAPGR